MRGCAGYRWVIMRFDLIWSGNWGKPNLPHSFVDPVHVQWCSIARQNSLIRGEWYPLSGANIPGPPTCPRAIDYAAHISQEFFNQVTRYYALRKML
jgi:hypothetical protein